MEENSIDDNSQETDIQNDEPIDFQDGKKGK